MKCITCIVEWRRWRNKISRISAKKCRRQKTEYQRKWRKENPHKTIRYNRAPWRRASSNVYRRRKYQTVPRVFLSPEEKKRRNPTYQKRYYVKHWAEIKARYLKTYGKTRLRRERYAEKYRKRPEVALRGNLRCLLRNALNKYSKTGKILPSRKYGIDYGIIIQKLGPCPGNRKDWHIDHIRPMVSFDLNDLEQIRQAFSPGNLQWLPAKVNISKGGRWHDNPRTDS